KYINLFCNNSSRYASADNEGNVRKCEIQIEKIKNQISHLNQEICIIDERLLQNRTRIGDVDVIRRNIADNIRFRKLTAELEKTKETIGRLEDERENIDAERLKAKYNRLTESLDALRQEVTDLKNLGLAFFPYW